MFKRSIIALTVFILGIVYVPYAFAQDASPEGNTVLQRVKEKVEALKKNPKAFIGTITDLTDTSIQIKDIEGKIELVSLNDASHYTKIDKGESDIKFTDIAIGDYIAALGTFGTGQVLNARRVLLVSPPDLSRKIVSGTVSSIVKKTITLDTAGGSVTLTFPSKWKGPEVKEFSEGDKAVAVVNVDPQGKLTVRTIQKI